MTTATAGPAPDSDLAAPLHTNEDVLRRVDLLLDEDARRLRSVVLLFLDRDGVQLPVVVPIDDVPERPDPLVVGNLCWIIAEALRQYPGGSAVVALTRPDIAQPDDYDRHWCRLLDAAAQQHHASIRLVCLATPSSVRALSDGSVAPGRAG